jgi:hypothetical protein
MASFYKKTTRTAQAGAHGARECTLSMGSRLPGNDVVRSDLLLQLGKRLRHRSTGSRRRLFLALVLGQPLAISAVAALLRA